MTSLTMMARVRPTRAIDRSWWRPAKASSSSRFTGSDGTGRNWRVAIVAQAGRRGGATGLLWERLQPRAFGPLRRQGEGPRQELAAEAAPTRAGKRRLLPGPQVRQAAHLPPGLGFLVVVPALGVAHVALGHGVLVDHAQVEDRKSTRLNSIH